MSPSPITLHKRNILDAKGKRSPKSGTVLAWPVSLAESEIPRFPQGLQLFLFPEDPRNQPPTDEPELRRKEAQRAVLSTPENTRQAYDSDLKSFHLFCAQYHRSPCPALPETVTLYLDWQANRGLAAATMGRRLTSISREHTLAGHPTPCADPQVRDCLKGIRREIGTAPHPKTPISADDLKSMLESAGNSVRGLRDRALLALGFASGCRRAELVALNLDDASFEPQGIRIRIRRSKTDHDGQGQEAAAHRGHRKATCPVRALQAWIAARGRQPGPLFVRVLKTGKVTAQRLTGRAVARVVKRMARAVGLDETQYSGHSLRAGCATSASGAGADVLAIQRRLRHANISTTSKYIRHGSLFICDPLQGVL